MIPAKGIPGRGHRAEPIGLCRQFYVRRLHRHVDFNCICRYALAMLKLTEGNITRQLVLFAVPVLLGQSLQRLYTLADTVLVGRLLGTSSLAAVGASSTIAIFLIVMTNGFSSGFSIVIAQQYGAGSREQMRKSLASAYLLSLGICALLSAASLALIDNLLAWTHVPQDIFAQAKEYLQIVAAGLFATMMYNLTADILRALGDSTVPLVFLILSVMLNIALDYFFIARLGTGVKGAAIATVISQLVSGTLCIVFCALKRPLLKVSMQDFAFSRSRYSALISQGLAMSLMFSVVSAGSVILQGGINSLGQNLIAGYTAGRKYLELFMTPAFALSVTAAAFTSQNFGAKNYGRIRSGISRLLLFGFIWATAASAVIFAFGSRMTASVTGRDAPQEVIRAGTIYMKSNVVFFYFLVVLVTVRTALQGMNRKKTPIAASLIELAVKIAAAIILVPKIGFAAICAAEPSIWILGAAWVFTAYTLALRKLLKPQAEIPLS